ncbi:MAG: hypothetical protein KR126chlam3_01258 [Chlamydiae bacterium]|nr:hypothetical protein [Chlamydiota bacterium]
MKVSITETGSPLIISHGEIGDDWELMEPSAEPKQPEPSLKGIWDRWSANAAPAHREQAERNAKECAKEWIEEAVLIEKTPKI